MRLFHFFVFTLQLSLIAAQENGDVTRTLAYLAQLDDRRNGVPDIEKFCKSCFADSIDNYWCNMGESFVYGLCCQPNSDPDDNDFTAANCANYVTENPYCVKADKSELEGFAKYVWCSYDRYKCGSPTRKLVADYRRQDVYTSLAFSESDICVYELTTLSDFQVEIGLELVIEDLENVQAYLMSGGGFDELSTLTELKSGDIVGLTVTEANWIVVSPLNGAPMFGMNYRVKNLLNLKDLCFDYGQYLLIIIFGTCVLGVCMNALSIVFRT